jgi:hypothetical protein
MSFNRRPGHRRRASLLAVPLLLLAACGTSVPSSGGVAGTAVPANVDFGVGRYRAEHARRRAEHSRVEHL